MTTRTYPEILDRPTAEADPRVTRAHIGLTTCVAIFARSFGRVTEDGALRFRISERDDLWVFVALAANDTYMIESGQYVVGGPNDGAWVSIQIQDEIYCSDLSAAVLAVAGAAFMHVDQVDEEVWR